MPSLLCSVDCTKIDIGGDSLPAKNVWFSPPNASQRAAVIERVTSLFLGLVH